MASAHPLGYRTLASLSRINLLHELQQHGSRTVTELAGATGLHHNTAREHLNRLIEAGLVVSQSILNHRKGRPRILYHAAQGAESATRRAWLEASEQRSELLHRLLPFSVASTGRGEVGRQLDVLDDHMEQCGFDAEIEPDGSRMTMHECPFGDLAKDNPQVCQVHFALVKDALELADGPLRATELHPFVEPSVCIVDMECPRSDRA